MLDVKESAVFVHYVHSPYTLARTAIFVSSKLLGLSVVHHEMVLFVLQKPHGLPITPETLWHSSHLVLNPSVMVVHLYPAVVIAPAANLRGRFQ